MFRRQHLNNVALIIIALIIVMFSACNEKHINSMQDNTVSGNLLQNTGESNIRKNTEKSIEDTKQAEKSDDTERSKITSEQENINSLKNAQEQSGNIPVSIITPASDSTETAKHDSSYKIPETQGTATTPVPTPTPQPTPYPSANLFEKPRFKGVRSIYFDDNDELKEFIEKNMPEGYDVQLGKDYIKLKDPDFKVWGTLFYKQYINFYHFNCYVAYKWGESLTKKLLELITENPEKIYEFLFISPNYEDGYYIDYPHFLSLSKETYDNMERVVNELFRQTAELPEELKNVFWEMNRRLLNEDASPAELFCLSFNLSLKWHRPAM